MLIDKVSKIRDNFAEYTDVLAEHTGDFVEQSIGNRISQKYEAPQLMGKPEMNTWYRIPIETALSGDGSEYHIYIKKRRTKNLCIFFSGGGVAWDKNMASQPVTGGRVAAGAPNYYWSNLRPFTQIMNINIGITENRARNPFHGWNFGIIPYSTGDFHIGNNELLFEDNGEKKKLHFCGYHNFRLSMDEIKRQFPKAEHILIAGESAGAFAVPALTEEIIEDYYPECEDISVFSDSALLKRKNWKETLEDVWKAPERIVCSQHSENITLDWYDSLMKKMGKRCHYFYASSVEDYLLSSFQNEIDHGVFETNEEAQKRYFNDLKEMHEEFSSLSQPVNFFYYDWKNPLYTKGGSVHTAVRQPYFYQKSQGVTTMAHWLHEGVKDHRFNVGVNLLLK